jgi:hypothetical protein
VLSLAKGLRVLKSDVDELSEGGLAPAVALGKALSPPRIVAAGVAAALSPFVLGFGLGAVLIALIAG